MPIYEYKCSNCGHEYEIIQKMGDSPIVECQECHKNTATRLVSAAGFQLKGTGWYVTDFKDKGKESKKKDSTVTKPDAASKEPVKTESKSANTKGEDK